MENGQLEAGKNLVQQKSKATLQLKPLFQQLKLRMVNQMKLSILLIQLMNKVE